MLNLFLFQMTWPLWRFVAATDGRSCCHGMFLLMPMQSPYSHAWGDKTQPTPIDNGHAVRPNSSDVIYLVVWSICRDGGKVKDEVALSPLPYN